jgi:hypothetical protein
MLPPAADRTKLTAVLAQLGGAVEELLLSGLTTASDATRQTLAAAMQEAARYRLLRLGSTLRGALEELGRFTAQDAGFGRRRLTFFLSRAWLLGRGLAHALQTEDEKAYDRLTWSPPTQPVAKVEVVCVGVVKKVATGAFVAFEFRLRALADCEPVKAGRRLAWSVVFPTKPGVGVPPEGFLQLPQKQKFAAVVFLEKKRLTIERATVALDEAGGGRLSLTEQSTVVVGDRFDDWQQFFDWSPEAVLERVRRHQPDPLDLDTELQEEIVLRDYEIGAAVDGDSPGQSIYPIAAGRLQFSAVVGAEVEGKALRKNLGELQTLTGDRPPLYGLMHYERCKLIFQPLTALKKEPEYLTISKENVNKAALLKAMSFK